MLMATMLMMATPAAATVPAEVLDTVAAEDTTFLYTGDEEDDVILSESDIDDFVHSVRKEWSGDLPWWGKALFIIFAVLLVTLLFFIFTAPLWVLALIIWLIYRSNKRQPASPSIFDAPTGTDTYLWRKGMNQVAWGAGLLIAALVLSSRLIAAIGLVLACLGGSKLYLANRERSKDVSDHTAQEP